MKKITAVLQLLLAVMIAVAAMATLFNLVRLVTRPETISVVSAMIGQGLIIICMVSPCMFYVGIDLGFELLDLCAPPFFSVADCSFVKIVAARFAARANTNSP